MALVLAVAAPVATPQVRNRPASDYRLELWIRPVGDHPLVEKLGRAEVTVYPQGLKADSLWLDGLLRRGSTKLTLVKPLARLYASVSLDELSDVIRKMAGGGAIAPGLGPFTVSPPTDGRINRHPARRHRIITGKGEWVDVWTSSIIPENSQLKKLTAEVLEAVSDDLSPLLDDIDGNPILVRLHTDRYRDVDILGFSSIRRSSAGHEEDLALGRFYIRAKIAEKLWE